MNMIRSAKNQIAELTAAAYRAAVQEGLLPEGVQTIPAVEIPKDTANGDYTTTFALAAAKALGKIAGGVTFVNSVASTVCVVLLYLALRPALEHAKLLTKGEKK